jgi:hypothetical protein
MALAPKPRGRFWMWGVLIVALIAVLQFFLSAAHPPIGVYVAVLGLAAAAVTLRDQPDKWEKAAWIFLMFSLACLEIANLYRDRDEHDREASELRQTEKAYFEKTVNQITGGPSYAVVTPIAASVTEPPVFRMAVGIGKNGERYSLSNVRLSIQKLPVAHEGTKEQLLDILAGRGQPPVWQGSIDPESSTLLPTFINIAPPMIGTASYAINVYANNKPTVETLRVRFNQDNKHWEYAFKVIRALKIGGPGKPDDVETLEESNPEWQSTVFIETK